MRQIFLLIVLFFVGHWLSRKLKRAQGRQEPHSRPNQASGTASSPGTPRLAEPMIRCAECGVHAPKSDSVTVAGQAFCCADHAQRHAARSAGRDAR
ncbi:PP0621 family protein [Paraburkholderia bonniea]|uniref:PP0621 family protein n=1 Tax=Paraburkholderia bonniea TaxID=2152891 RepID=UPI001291883B|nr:PP0621 family protein [Paraburkholderia bonniea]WJF89903.1 PP0621 family protein [Paraburkholderia bonniea]WJF93217.1 PP0621 family protein [Paraburkholderia bonniea]